MKLNGVSCPWAIFRTLKYFPAKSCTPIIAKISQKIKHTNNTLKMDGIACTSAFTTTCEKVQDLVLDIWHTISIAERNDELWTIEWNDDFVICNSNEGDFIALFDYGTLKVKMTPRYFFRLLKVLDANLMENCEKIN